jgi:chitinase domain-containing protein 1
MTYDFSSPSRPGPNSPISWIKDCILALSPEPGKLRSKLMMGLNFYGFDFSHTGSSG